MKKLEKNEMKSIKGGSNCVPMSDFPYASNVICDGRICWADKLPPENYGWRYCSGIGY
jgi:hypothetical protein